MDGIVRPPDGIACETDLPHLLCYDCQKYLALGACNILSDAAMNSDTQCEVTASTAANIEAVGVCPMIGVEVGGAQHAQDLSAFFQIEAGDRCSRDNGAAERMNG